MEEDVELCLEIQVDPASKKILSNPEKCRSTLLDVTVVKPKEMDAFGTQKYNTLRAEDVRKLITSMEKERRQKQKVLDQLKYDDTIIRIKKHEDLRKSRKPFTKHKEIISSSSPVDDLERKDFIGIGETIEPLFCEIRRSLKNVETRITNMQDINLVLSKTTVEETGSEEIVCPSPKHKKPNPLPNPKNLKKHSVYRVASEEMIYPPPKAKSTTPLIGPKSLKNHSVYRVETAPHNLKSVLLCQNKQKLLERGDRIEGKCLCENCGIVGLLMECQKHPVLPAMNETPSHSDHRQVSSTYRRARLNVPHFDNFKPRTRNDFPYINQLSNRVSMLEERLSVQEEKLVPKEYFRKIINKMMTNFSPKLFKSKSDTSMHPSEKNSKKYTKSEKKSTTYKKSTCCLSAGTSFCNKAQQTASKYDKSTITDEEPFYGGYIWKWGEEILKPGIDLKNRIVILLNEILNKFALTETNPSARTKLDESDKTETFRRCIGQMNAKVYNAQIDTRSKFPSTDYQKGEKQNCFEPVGMEEPAKVKTNQARRTSEKYNERIDISYVNPKLSLWRTDSPEMYKAISKLSEQQSNALGKQEFVKIVSKAKQSQKEVLWKNIWNQARANGQSKKDKITIKIPCQNKDSKGRQKMYETEVTIGEVEEILKGV